MVSNPHRSRFLLPFALLALTGASSKTCSFSLDLDGTGHICEVGADGECLVEDAGPAAADAGPSDGGEGPVDAGPVACLTITPPESERGAGLAVELTAINAEEDEVEVTWELLDSDGEPYPHNVSPRAAYLSSDGVVTAGRTEDLHVRATSVADPECRGDAIVHAVDRDGILPGVVLYFGSHPGYIHVQGMNSPIGSTGQLFPGPFIIHGIEPWAAGGTATFRGWLDPIGASGYVYAAAPYAQVTVSADEDGLLQAPILILEDPPGAITDPEEQPTAEILGVLPVNEAAIVVFNPAFDEEGHERAIQYTVTAECTSDVMVPTRSTSAYAGPGVVLIDGLVNGETYEFSITPSVGLIDYPETTFAEPVTAGEATGGIELTGDLDVSEIDTSIMGSVPPVSEAYLVALHNGEVPVAATRVAFPMSSTPESFSLHISSEGTVEVVVVLNLDGNGVVYPWNLIRTRKLAYATGTTVAMPDTLVVPWDFWHPAVFTKKTASGYDYYLNVESGFLPISRALVVAGPSPMVLTDLELKEDYLPSFHRYLGSSTTPMSVGSSWTLELADGYVTTEAGAVGPAPTAEITGYVSGFAAALTADQTSGLVLSWDDPSTMPSGDYHYEVRVEDGTGHRMWSRALAGAAPTSVTYDGDTLSPGDYQWVVSLVDENRNWSEAAGSFTIAP